MDISTDALDRDWLGALAGAEQRVGDEVLVRNLLRALPTLTWLGGNPGGILSEKLFAFRAGITFCTALARNNGAIRAAVDSILEIPLEFLDHKASYPKPQFWAYNSVTEIGKRLTDRDRSEKMAIESISHAGMAVHARFGGERLDLHFDYDNLLENIITEEEHIANVLGSLAWRHFKAETVLDIERRDAFDQEWMNYPIWSVPEITERYKEFASSLRKERDVWAFWARWYERMLAGNPLPWDLQEAVALIPDDIWEAGPEAVAAEIEKIEAAFYGQPLPDEVARSAAEQMLQDASVYSDILAGAAQSLNMNITLFQNQAQLNGLPDGFTGFGLAARKFEALSERLWEVDKSQSELEALKSEVQALNRVIQELRRELRETRRDLLAATHLPEQASRFARIGRAAKETILLAGAFGGLASGIFAGMTYYDQSLADYLGLRTEARELAETMANLDAPETNGIKK